MIQTKEWHLLLAEKMDNCLACHLNEITTIDYRIRLLKPPRLRSTCPKHWVMSGERSACNFLYVSYLKYPIEQPTAPGARSVLVRTSNRALSATQQVENDGINCTKTPATSFGSSGEEGLRISARASSARASVHMG